MNKTTELNELKDRIHSGNKLWWTDLTTGEPIKRDRRELLALVLSEVVEALEGVRKNLPDDKLPHRKMEEVELIDSYIRLLDLAGGYKIELRHHEYRGFIVSSEPVALFELMKLVVRAETEDYLISTCLAFIRAYCDKKGYDLETTLEEKCAYNASRLDHTREHRLSENGKKF